MAMSGPIVSVLLTSYNQGQWLQEAIESVLAQTYRAWELIIIDNGSIDNSPAIIEEYRTHPQIKVLRYEQNLPHTMICNAGVAAARGRYISLLCSDDYYLPEKLERQVAVFEGLSAEYGVIYSAGYLLLPEGEFCEVPCGCHRGNVLEALITQSKLFLPISTLIRRECFLRYPFNERIFMEGEGIFSRIALRYLFEVVPEPLVVMRDHEGTVGKEIRSNVMRNVIMYDELFNHPEFPGELKHLRGLALGATYRLGGWEAIRRERDYQQGREWLRQAIRCNARLLKDPRVLVGLGMSSLPRPLANICNRIVSLVMGVPTPPPLASTGTPVHAGWCSDGKNDTRSLAEDQRYSIHG
jgi:glycosyltransferase involved in cell wall biosynthesis